MKRTTIIFLLLLVVVVSALAQEYPQKTTDMIRSLETIDTEPLILALKIK